MSKEKTKAIKKKASRRQKKDWIAAYIFIAPVTIGLLIFYVWPFIQNFWFSFNDVNKFNMATFCGLDNYKKLFEEPDLMLALKNTMMKFHPGLHSETEIFLSSCQKCLFKPGIWGIQSIQS